MTFSSPELSPRSRGVQYNFGPFSFRPDGSLLRRSSVIFLPPKETLVLRLFLDSAGEVISLVRLRQCAWGDIHVSSDSLPRLISSLRARLELADCIQAVYKRGYRFGVEVERVEIDAPTLPASNPVPNPLTAATSSLACLVVLPFAIAAGVPEYLGSGITEEVILRISRSRNPVAKVVPCSSVLALVAQGRPAREIAKTLNADLLVVGSLFPLPKHFRIRVEMIRVSDDVQHWVEDFLVPRPLMAQSDLHIAKRICARVRESFASDIAPVPQKLDLVNENHRSEAYTRYLQAKAQWNTSERHLMQDSIRGMHQALELDSGLIAAKVHLVHNYLAMGSFGYMRPDLTADLALKLADQVQAAPASAQLALPAVGWIHFFRGRDPQAAAAVFARVQSSVHNLWTVVYKTRFALGQGRTDVAAQILRAALEIDPYAPELHWRLAWTLHLDGETNEALEQAKRTLTLFPNDPGALLCTSTVFAAASGGTGDSQRKLGAEAIALATRLTQLAPLLDSGFSTLAYAHARSGNHGEAHTILERQRWLGSERFVLRSFQAPAYVELGEYDAALDALHDADEQRCSWLFEFMGDPRLQPLHSMAEFRRLSQFSENMRDDDVSVA